MNNIPKDATHYGVTSAGTICFYKLEGDTWYFLYAVAAEKGGVWCRVWDNIPSHTPLTEIKRQFTKADLLDGMRVTMRCGYEWYVCGKEKMVALEEHHFGQYYESTFFWDCMKDTLEHGSNSQYDIVKVVDRDNTTVWERQEAPTKKKVTLELTDEQIAQVKAQFML